VIARQGAKVVRPPTERALMTSSPNITIWRTIGFSPDSFGWRAVYLRGKEGTTAQRVVGWLMEEMMFIDENLDYLPPEQQAPLPNTRVIAGVVVEGEVEPVNRLTDFWLLLAPDQEPPSKAEEKHERERRAAIAAKRASQQTET
jgi:hypothetical protein